MYRYVINCLVPDGEGDWEYKPFFFKHFQNKDDLIDTIKASFLMGAEYVSLGNLRIYKGKSGFDDRRLNYLDDWFEQKCNVTPLYNRL